MVIRPSPGKQTSAYMRRALLRPTAWCVLGLLLIGASGAWLPAGGGLPALSTLGLGGVLTALGGRRLIQLWLALNYIINTVTQADDVTLLPTHIPLPAGSPLAALGAKLTDMGEQVRGLVGQLQMQADQVRDIAARMVQAAAGHEGNANAQAAALGEVAAAMAELDTIVVAVTQTAHEVALAAEEVRTASAGSRNVVGAAVASLNDTRRRVGETLQAIEQLRAQVEQIGAINGVIAGIAEQTHILSLNAAIEAADAGVEGRRFSVVAGEVRVLAAGTRDQGKEVRRLVGELETAVTVTVAAAKAGIQQTAHTADLTTTLTTTTTELAATAGRTQHLAAAIDAAMDQQRTGTAGVVQTLNDISGATQRIRAQAAAITGQATDLSVVAGHLRDSALRFGVSRTPNRTMRLLIGGRETVSERSRAWQALVIEWNASHPNATLAIEFVPPGPDYLPDIERALIAGTAPDIFQLTDSTHLARKGYLAPLDDLLTPAMQADFYPVLLNAEREGGHVYALPTEAQPSVLFYNKALLADLHLAPPRTWTDWIEVGRRCRTDSRWGVMLETAPGDFRTKLWVPFFWQGGGDIPEDADPACFATPAAQAAIGLWRDLLITHHIAPLKPPYPSYDIANLAEGHCAMQYVGTWAINMLCEKYPNFDYGVVDVPQLAGGRPATLLLHWSLAVNAHSPQRDQACAFVQWALASEGVAGVARSRALITEGLPFRRSIVPLIEAEGGANPIWRMLINEVYPHCAIPAQWPNSVIARADQALDVS